MNFYKILLIIAISFLFGYYCCLNSFTTVINFEISDWYRDKIESWIPPIQIGKVKQPNFNLKQKAERF